MKKLFNTQYEDVKAPSTIVYDKFDGVERDGVVPLRSQIRMYKEAGVLLKATRALQYDSGSEISDFEKVDTAFRDARDYADMSELVARSMATSKVLDIVSNGSSTVSKETVEVNSLKVETPVSEVKNDR